MTHVNSHRLSAIWGMAIAFVVLACGSGFGQQIPSEAGALEAGALEELGNASHLIIPQTSTWNVHSPHQRSGIVITGVEAAVRLVEQTATTTLDIHLKNVGLHQAEAIVLLPVPQNAAVSGFAFEGSSTEPIAQLLRREVARQMYDNIVRQVRDPALLEFAGYNLIRTSVFPVEPQGTQRIRLTYETVLQGDGNRIDYVLPRSELLVSQVPWNISVDVQAQSPISMVYSPSHDLIEDERSGSHIRLHVSDDSANDPGAFQLSYLLERSGVSASLFAYPDPKIGGGYFLFLAGLPARIADIPKPMKREVTIVLDRSGSMSGGKLDQVQAAALQIIEGLEDGESFNVIDYSHTVERFSKHPVVRTDAAVQQAREYFRSLRPNGGTNIHDALVEALRQPPSDDYLPIVLFLTDGLPTVGNTSEVAIRSLIEEHNVHQRRVFTFGVGADVNVPLLEAIAERSRARTTFVLPDEDIELKVAQTFKRLYGPVFADIQLETHSDIDEVVTPLVRELIPEAIPDVFEGDHIILLGQYKDSDTLTFGLSGNFLGDRDTFSFTFDLDRATTKNAFVPRLWAARRIASLVDIIRQAGAQHSGQVGSNASILNDPKYRELVDEIVRLSAEFGILSEYTSFLALDGTNFQDWNALVTACSTELGARAIETRSGVAAVNQGKNIADGKRASKLNYDNYFYDDTLQAVTFDNVQQINDKAFFCRAQQWIDASLINVDAGEGDEVDIDRTIAFGSDEHLEIVHDLASQARQGALALPGDIFLKYKGKTILIKAPDKMVSDSPDDTHQ